MQDKITNILSQALAIDKKSLTIDSLKKFISTMRKVLNENKKMLEQSSKIDVKNENGILINFDIVENIFKNIQKENIMYGSTITSKYDETQKLLYGKEYLDAGIVIICSDGNPYIMLEMILRNVLAGNVAIFVNSGYCYGTNHFLIKITQNVLNQLNLPCLIDLLITEDENEVLSNFANINLVVVIGNHSLQNRIIGMSKNKCIVSGYENFELYIEEEHNIDFIKNLSRANLPIQFFIKKDLNLEMDNAIIVEDIEEAIAQINFNGSHYSSAIFTSNENHASQFVKEIKSSVVTVNTSPTIERVLDLKQQDLMIEKTIIYPASYDFGIRMIFTKED